MPKHSVDLYMLWMVWQKLFRKCIGDTKIVFGRTKVSKSSFVKSQRVYKKSKWVVMYDLAPEARKNRSLIFPVGRIEAIYRASVFDSNSEDCPWFRTLISRPVYRCEMSSLIRNCARLLIAGDSFELSVYRQIAKIYLLN